MKIELYFDAPEKVNQDVENSLFFHSFSKAVFEASQGRKPLFHGFHMPYYYYLIYISSTTILEGPK